MHLPSNHFSLVNDPSKVLSCSSLLHDEKSRHEHTITFAKTGRGHVGPPPNGNLRLLIPDIDNPDVRKALPPAYQVDTSSRTVFNTDRVYDTKDGIADKVASPRFKCSAPKQTGHKPMNVMVPHDPRQSHMPPPTSEDLGPGAYTPHEEFTYCSPRSPKREGSPDRTGSPNRAGSPQRSTSPNRAGSPRKSTGSPNRARSPGLRWLPFHKDPSRPSAAFLSPDRDHTMDRINAERRSGQQPCYMLPPNYASWTEHGITMTQGSRVIQAERWGHSLRNPRPPPDELSQTMEDLQVEKTLRPATCAAYVSDPNSPTYRTAFRSHMPRTTARTAHLKQDTRLQTKTFAKTTAAGPNLGPGSHDPQLPTVFASHHVAFNLHQPPSQPRTPSSPTKSWPASTPGSPPRAHASGSSPTRSTHESQATLASTGKACMEPPSHAGMGPISVPEDVHAVLSSPVLSPQSRGPSPWHSLDMESHEPVGASGAETQNPGSAVPRSLACSPTPGAMHGCTPRSAACTPVNGPHAALLGSLIPPADPTLPITTTPTPTGTTSKSRRVRSASIEDDKKLAEVQRMLERDWAVHQLMVKAKYASTDELRGAATMQRRAVSDCVPGQLAGTEGLSMPALGTTGCVDGGAVVGCEGKGTGVTYRLQWGEQQAGSWVGMDGVPVHVNTRVLKDKQLMFLRRVVPHKALVHQQLRAIADMRATRRATQPAARAAVPDDTE